MWTRILAIAMALALTGCASFDLNNAGARTAIEAATLQFIDGDQSRADRVYEVTDGLLSSAEGDAQPIRKTLDAMEARVRDRVQWDKLTDAEALLVHRLIDAVRAEVSARVNQGTLDESQRAAIQSVLRWIRDMAQLSGGFDGTAMEDMARDEGMASGRAAGPQRAAYRAG